MGYFFLFFKKSNNKLQTILIDQPQVKTNTRERQRFMHSAYGPCALTEEKENKICDYQSLKFISQIWLPFLMNV